MQFPTPLFAAFFLLFLPLWSALAGRPGWRALLGLGASGIFFACCGWLSLAVAAGCLGAGSLLAARAPWLSRARFACGCAALLLPLVYFKYGAWLSGMLGVAPSWVWSAGAPFGLSFYTFSLLAWACAAREGACPPAAQCASACVMFPVAAAGPVLRPKDAAAALAMPLGEVQFGRVAGPFLLGFFLKLVVSSWLARIADPIFATLDAAGPFELALALHAYAGQLYADFAGYSLMALGVGRALGVELPSNFEAPYGSRSIGEFWRRWHISLSTFWRERLYIPLGGSRRGPWREMANLMAVMLLCGLWHGAGWSFLAWGALHGAMLCAGRAWRWGNAPALPALLAWILAFEGAVWAWLPFRLDGAALAQAFQALTRPGEIAWPVASFFFCWLAIAIEHARKRQMLSWFEDLGRQRPFLCALICALAAIACVELAPEGIPPFIYSNF